MLYCLGKKYVYPWDLCLIALRPPISPQAQAKQHEGDPNNVTNYVVTSSSDECEGISLSRQLLSCRFFFSYVTIRSCCVYTGRGCDRKAHIIFIERTWTVIRSETWARDLWLAADKAREEGKGKQICKKKYTSLQRVKICRCSGWYQRCTVCFSLTRAIGIGLGRFVYNKCSPIICKIIECR